MLAALTLGLALLAILISVHGGFLSTHDKTHRRVFIVYGVAALIMIAVQGWLIYSEQRQARIDQANLRDQITALVNATRLQATLDDIKGMHKAITEGFGRLESVLNPLTRRPALTEAPKAQPQAEAKPEPKTEPKSEPKPEAKEPLGPPTVEHVRLTQRRAPSDKAETPYGLQAILQSDTTIQPAAFRLVCDGEISEGRFFIAGQAVIMSMAQGLSRDRRAFEFSFRYPPFTPEAPIIVTLLSKSDIRITRVERIAPMF
jgi:hypothetical protein